MSWLKWQLKTLFLAIFDPSSSMVNRVFDCRLFGVLTGLAFLIIVLTAEIGGHIMCFISNQILILVISYCMYLST